MWQSLNLSWLAILFLKSILMGNKRHAEALWRDFFSDTSQWWDHRPEKVNPRFPDFKHKQTGEALWLADARNPSWVQAKLAAIPAGTLRSNVFAWTQRLRRHAKAGQYMKTLEVFRQMQQERISPDARTFLPVLNACAGLGALEMGICLHKQIMQSGCESDVFVASCLVDMYAKCGSIEDAWSTFDKMGERNVVSWSTIIAGYVKAGQGLKAIELFWKMQLDGLEPDAVTFVGVLSACASVMALEEGRRVHVQIIERGWESDVYVANCLVDMYAKCRSIDDAWSMFSKMRERNVVSWSAMIAGYVKSGQGLKAMEIFRRMQQEMVEPNAVTFVAVLNACASVAALEDGRLVHELIIAKGWESHVYVANCLVDMYAKSGSIADAWSVFEKMQEHDVVSWNSMIGGYLKSGQGLQAIKLFRKMQLEAVEPDAVTFVGVLNACASVLALEEGRCVHVQVIERGYESDVRVANCLVDMYAKCGSIEDAWIMFNKMERNVVSWSAMIAVYVQSGQGSKAMEIFRRMQQERVEPNAVTFVAVLNACTSIEHGRHVHEQIIERGCEAHVDVANCLVVMYTRCGSLEDASTVFHKMQEPNVVSWSAMIGGFVKSGQLLKAMNLFRRMQQEGVEPNAVTFVVVLNGCASAAALNEGRLVHEQIIQSGCEYDVNVANSLVDMYAKCGSIEDASSVFNAMPEHDVISWNAMIGGYAIHGHAKKAIEFFKQMGKEGVEINGITFTCVLSACSHVGLVKEGMRYFRSMTSCFNLHPTVEHYACMVDLLGRAGWLQEAEDIANRLPVKRDACVWMSLLAACRIHGNIEMAERAAKWCWELDPENTSGHVLLSNIYAAFCKGGRLQLLEKRG